LLPARLVVVPRFVRDEDDQRRRGRWCAALELRLSDAAAAPGLWALIWKDFHFRGGR